MSSRPFFSDEPVNGSPGRPDALGRGRYAEHVVRILRRVRGQDDSVVLSLVGSWGSGKSSVLNLVTSRLSYEASGQEAWSIAELNPWLYQDPESLALALFGEIREALPKGDRWSTARQTLASYAGAVSPIGKLAGLIGFMDVSELAKTVADRMAGDTSASATRHKAEKALRDVCTPVLVVMDDLDRLTPDELLVVFKMVRLVGRLPNVHYLLCFDERTLLDVLQRSDLVGGEESRAREFLEKMIQVRLDLPAFRDQDAIALVEQAIDELLSGHGITFSEPQLRRFGESYHAHLGSRLRTPRAIKRYFAQADASLATVVGNVDPVDFLLLTFLRTMEPALYAALPGQRAALTGTDFSPSHAAEARAAEWRRLIADAGVAPGHCEGVLDILCTLFGAVARTVRPGIGVTGAPVPLGAGHVDYFDRYFAFGVTEDDLSEADFRQALAQLAAGAQGPERDRLVLLLGSDTHRIVRRIRDRLSQGEPLPLAEVLELMADQYRDFNTPAQGHGILTAEGSVRFAAADLLRAVAEHDRPDVLERMAATCQGAELAALALAYLVVPDGQPLTQAAAPGLPPWALEGRTRLVTAFPTCLEPARTRSATDLTGCELSLLVLWHVFAPDQVRAWVHTTLRNSHWLLLELVIRLVPDSPAFPGSAGEFTDRVESLIGLDNATRTFGPALDNATRQPTDTSLWNPTSDQRRDWALTVLRDWRDRQSGP
ncbi:KAP family NTPase [Embleya sp. NBC_00888]|uniref:P-loop NTPase fold protein n=1 Tax=Embleya sp. NBC_00888 TaxID=2975960 RepID=UPI0038647763|nr:KAP family NTPase [Embleya sp. NBC_00888]